MQSEDMELLSIFMQTDNDYNVSKCCQGGSWRDSSAKGSGNVWFNSENDFYKRCHIFWESEPAHYFSFCKYIHIGDKGFNGKYDFIFFISFICTDSQKLLHQFELCGQLYTTCCHYDWRLQNSTFAEKTRPFSKSALTIWYEVPSNEFSNWSIYHYYRMPCLFSTSFIKRLDLYTLPADILSYFAYHSLRS